MEKIERIEVAIVIECEVEHKAGSTFVRQRFSNGTVSKNFRFVKDGYYGIPGKAYAIVITEEEEDGTGSGIDTQDIESP